MPGLTPSLELQAVVYRQRFRPLCWKVLKRKCARTMKPPHYNSTGSFVSMVTTSLSTIFRSRRLLGWTFCGSSYCQLIRDVNKVKRLEWARQYTAAAEAGFNDVIYSDKTSIQLETHRCFCCCKQGEPPKNKPRLLQILFVENKKFIEYVYTCTVINPRRACARVTVYTRSVCVCVCLSVCLSVCVFSLFWHLAQSGVQTAVSATSARYGHEI